MKVVVAHNRYREAMPSGENVIVDQEMAELTAAGVTVLPFLRSSDDIPSLSPAKKALLPVAPIWSPSAARDLTAMIKTERPDVLHLHNPYPLISPWVVSTAHRFGVPVVHTVHNYRQVCASALYFRDGHVCHDCRGRLLPLPAVRHACYRGSRAQSAVMATALTVHRPTWRSVNRFVALTSMISAHLESYGIPADRITVKPNAIPDPGRPPPLGDGFLFLARFSPEKGLELLLDAWRRHPVGSLGVLRLAGDGDQRALAVAAASERSDVEYLGQLDRAGVAAAVAASSVVVAAPLWHDVLPTAVIEALAAGRPVLGTEMGGVPYLIGDAGWTVPPTVDGLAAALPVARDGASALSSAARLRYERTFHPDVVTKRLLDVYESVRRAQ